MKYIEFLLEFQRTLIYVALESLSPIFMLPNVEGGQYSSNPEKWKRLVIEFIVKNLQAKLIEEFPSRQIELGDSRIHQICEILNNSDPTENPEIWMVMQFSGTDELSRILSIYGLNQWEGIHKKINPEFIEELSRRYERASNF